MKVSTVDEGTRGTGATDIGLNKMEDREDCSKKIRNTFNVKDLSM